MPSNNFITSARNIAGSAAKTVGTVRNTFNALKTDGVGAALRAANLLPGGETGAGGAATSASFVSSAKDWRVRLSLPQNETFLSSGIIKPLIATNGLVFPYTPSIQISHVANYTPFSPTHSNYPVLQYQNSSVDSFTVQAPFYCEDSSEAAYWIAAVHFLKSVTKMSFGPDANAGAPPPILKLNGYGDYVFKNVPVVVTNFQMDLPNTDDYISTGLSYMTEQERMLAEQNEGFEDDEIDPASKETPKGISWAPVKSTLQITLQPIYSREQMRQFSLEKFVKGDYILGDTSDPRNSTGFI